MEAFPNVTVRVQLIRSIRAFAQDMSSRSLSGLDSSSAEKHTASRTTRHRARKRRRIQYRQASRGKGSSSVDQLPPSIHQHPPSINQHPSSVDQLLSSVDQLPSSVEQDSCRLEEELAWRRQLAQQLNVFTEHQLQDLARPVVQKINTIARSARGTSAKQYTDALFLLGFGRATYVAECGGGILPQLVFEAGIMIRMTYWVNNEFLSNEEADRAYEDGIRVGIQYLDRIGNQKTFMAVYKLFKAPAEADAKA